VKREEERLDGERSLRRETQGSSSRLRASSAIQGLSFSGGRFPSPRHFLVSSHSSQLLYKE
jgi:hypothetical protein